MKPTSLTLALALALVGCGDNLTDGTNPDDPNNPDNPDPETPLEVTGAYRLHSTFDIATNMPGTAGAFVNGLIEATDDPDDPMSWLLDQMIATMDDGAFKTFLQNAKPFVAGYLNDQLADLAPELVGTVTDLGHRMAYLTKHLGVEELLAVYTNDQQYVGQVIVDGVRFRIDETTVVDAPFAAHDLDDVITDGLHISYDNGRLGIGDHTLPLPYGQLVRIGLDAAIIPALDPSATGLADLLDHVVDCQGVGQGVADALGVGSTAFWKSVCLAGLDRAADLVYDQLVAADSALDFHLTGTARAADTDADRKLDKLTFGEWSGTLSYDGTDAPLAQPATFEGARE